ncbi:hypothetical protein RND81_05G021000 [Saponaria officinalis]|uniref:pyridoxal 5'-phosphate synthase (glutamine hydrolyzing) n=1 Tax=Saponaria officinalis TaxID=3572 RepID=A0AAW1KS10_SAPOF
MKMYETIIKFFIHLLQALTPADEDHHINKHNFHIPFVRGYRNLGEALHRIREDAAMIRTKGEAGTGNAVEAIASCAVCCRRCCNTC